VSIVRLRASGVNPTDWKARAGDDPLAIFQLEPQKVGKGSGDSAALHGFSIAQISDLHVGPTIKRDFLERVVDAVNGLGAPITELQVMMSDGGVWFGRNLDPGARQVLVRTRTQAPAPADAVAAILSGRTYWESLPDAATKDTSNLLRPGMYLATLSSNPFVEFPLGHGRETTSSGVVIGHMRGEGGGGAR
jgi:hypothetical protein